MARVRLDRLLVTRGLAPSRERARALILAGQVRVGDQPAGKAGTLVDPAADVSLVAPDHPWASRAGLKLAHGLDVFGLDVHGLTVLDVGASTGGFTDVLLARGAARVVALDVGRGQLDWRLRTDDRVHVLDGINARYLTAGDLPAGTVPVDFATVDVSFISLRLILPAVAPLVAPDGAVVVLVKPQFEAGRDEVGKGGIVRDASVHARVIDAVAAAAHQVGLERIAVEPSPVTGAGGNQEFLMLLRRRARPS